MPDAKTGWLLPHEVAFGIFLSATWAALVWVTGPFSRDALWFGGLLAVAAALVVWCQRQESVTRWRVRLAYYPVVMNAAYFALKTVVPALHPQLQDATLRAADRWLLGGSASVWLGQWTQPALSEVLSFCYVVFFPYLIFSWVYYLARKPLVVAQRFWSGFFTLYAVGFTGYLLVPAVGPHLDPAMAGQLASFHGPITDFNAGIVQAGSNRVDCFPSLHVAVSTYLLLFDFRECRWRFWLWLGPCVGLWVSTLYLGYHYFTDLLAGWLLTAVTLWAVNRWFRLRLLQTAPKEKTS
jgi:membrane-associated phospholipid phosphatase